MTTAGAPYSSPALGTPRLHLRVTDSTNERARALAMAGAPHGTLVTAAAQSAGRGRQGRSWSAPAGQALLMSLVLRDPPPLLPLIAAVAVCDAIGEDVEVKWPNDIVRAVADDGEPHRLVKLAGILVEGRSQERWAVLGIGINVAVRLDDLPPEIRDIAGSLQRDPAAVETLLASLLKSLDDRLKDPPDVVLDAWRAHDALRGREVAWSGGHGVAEGVDGSGRLVVLLPDGGRTALSAGEVHLRRG